MDAILDRSRQLKQDLIEFVLEAEGDLAVALESYIVNNAKSQKNRYDAAYEKKLLIDTFLTDGKVGDKTPIDLFLKSHPELSQSDRILLNKWQLSFIALFAVTGILTDGFELMNWLTAKNYVVKPNDPRTLEEMASFKKGEILLTRISPVTDDYWMFSGPCLPMGNLGKPKLAVAIGNFKDNHKKHLYSDAPDLLEQAWLSVEQYHRDFIEFFGSDELTMPGYKLNKKIAEFQEVITKRRLAAAGIDDSKFLDEIAEEAGISEEEIKAAATEAGADSKQVERLFGDRDKMKMMMPKVELPENLKKAEQVTVLTHPRWGQMFLTTYSKFKTILEADDWQSIPNAEKLINNYLEDEAINYFIWHRLAEQYPVQLEKLLQVVLNRPKFQLKSDLDPLLEEFNKPLEPELPEIASVPEHLHNLFQEAVAEVNKSKPKSKSQKKAVKGFGK
ncbi:MAG TPA: hypothetical protein VK203_14890 [Nostocaceae cyanobacterium]|nr:hypothetical protein [Nostocaceae cyanobacterium]